MMRENELLRAWMAMEINIKASRLLGKLSANEMFVCSFIYEAGKITSKELCDRTLLLKSQINRVVSSLSERGLVARQTDAKDKRRVYLSLSDVGLDIYLSEHEVIMKVVSLVYEELGEKNSMLLAELMNGAVRALRGK